MKYTTLILAIILTSCSGHTQPNKTEAQLAVEHADPIQVPLQNGIAKAYFASGCFWCVEAIYESLNGVTESISGYSGGHTLNPTYQSSNTGQTGHAETVEILYNPNIISFETLVDVYFGSQNVTQVNGQGPDYGSQYRSIIFYQNNAQKLLIEQKIEALSKTIKKPIAAEVLPFQKFWRGEDYHQDYEKLHPNHPYIQGVSIPRYNRFAKKFTELLKSETQH